MACSDATGALEGSFSREDNQGAVESAAVHAVKEAKALMRKWMCGGDWNLLPVSEHPARLKAAFTMHVEPGSLPATLANRRLRQTVSGALENLQQRFACADPG